MSNKERLGGESIWLYVDIGSSDLVDETTLSDVGVTANQESPGIGIDSGQTVHVLPDLFEILQGLSLPLHDGGHSTKCGSLELFASVERVTELQESHIVFGDLGDEMTGSVERTKSELVVVLVVKHVQQIGEERVKGLIVSSTP
jgi:hypothetical protein